MSYNKTIWTNGVTPNSETNMNKIENELEYLDGKVEDTGWINLTPLSPASTIAGHPLRYRQKAGITYIDGVIYYNQDVTYGTVLAVLPANFRPSTGMNICCRTIDSAAVTVIAIYNDGNITFLNKTSEGAPENSGIFIDASFISEM